MHVRNMITRNRQNQRCTPLLVSRNPFFISRCVRYNNSQSQEDIDQLEKETQNICDSRYLEKTYLDKDFEEDPSPSDNEAENQPEVEIDETAYRSALDKIYEAFRHSNPEKRIECANDAIERCPFCADAYNILAEEKAQSLREAQQYYRQGVEMGKRIIPQRYFTSMRGQFWKRIRNRGYLRSLHGLANCLAHQQMNDEALQIYDTILNLNPDDNQGVHLVLSDMYLRCGQEDHIREFLFEHSAHCDRGVYATTFCYSLALLWFRQNDVARYADALAKAFRRNIYVPEYLLGKPLPGAQPACLAIGQASEAVAYTQFNMRHWVQTRGAIEFLKQAYGRYHVLKLNPSNCLCDHHLGCVIREVAQEFADYQLRATCAYCGATNCELMCCAACQAVMYCSRACQRSDWKRHKAECVPRTSS
eukprot:gnl/Trimastix_PCT/978.p1 GENE.gnl/Trimastix_PCT/978~~gnl/Trimastix_PCT/978.p1  ORF type:complete len:436 (-),score=82.87 gnl/Trimastix_PCT/978:19-1275(-)